MIKKKNDEVSVLNFGRIFIDEEEAAWAGIELLDDDFVGAKGARGGARVKAKKGSKPLLVKIMTAVIMIYFMPIILLGLIVLFLFAFH